MDRVAELVEERAGLVVGEQRRLARTGLGHVEVVAHDGARLAEQGVLVDEAVHPRPALLRVTGVQVEQVEAEGRPVDVVHLEDADVGVVAIEVVALVEGQAVEHPGGVEDPVVEHPLGLEVGPHRGEVDGIPRRSDLLGPEGPVVRLDRVSGLLLEQRPLGLDVAGRRGGEAPQQVHDALGGARRGVGERCGGVRVVAEETRPLGPDPHGLEHEGLGVVGVVTVAAGALRLVEAPAHIAVGERGEVGMPGRQDEREEPRPLVAVLGSSRGGRRDLPRREAVEPA